AWRQCRPASPVPKIFASPFSASPALAANAAPSLSACIDRRSRAKAPGTVSAVQVRPPSRERTTVPRAPDAQTTPLPARLRPRNSADVGDGTYVHWAAACAGSASAAATSGARRLDRDGDTA